MWVGGVGCGWCVWVRRVYVVCMGGRANINWSHVIARTQVIYAAAGGSPLQLIYAGVSHDKCKRTHVTHISHIGPIIRDAGGACSSDSDSDLDSVFCLNDYLDLMKGRLQKCF